MKTLFSSLLLFAGLSSQMLGQSFGTVESIEFDPIYHRFLVSNVNSVMVADNNGQAVSQFGTAPLASYGMEVMNNALFAITGSSVKAFDLTSGLQTMTATISGAQFLNGMASNGTNMIWVTDFNAKKIHQIDVTNMASPVVSVLIANTVSTPNGIVYDDVNNRLVFVSWGTNAPIKQVDLATGVMSTITTTTLGNCDGIDNDNQGNYFVSSWSSTPKITKFAPDFSSQTNIVVTGLSSPADICYAKEIDTLAIPNSGNATVKYVGFTTSKVDEKTSDKNALSLYPNPVSNYSIARFYARGKMCRMDILDSTGKLVKNVLHENLGTGEQIVVLNELGLSAGMYFLSLEQNGKKETVPFVQE
jgi:sugar lactone lactonase YvrE